MEYKKINLIDNRNLSLDKYSEEMETCNECNIEAIVDTCNKCGNGVCRSDNCCLSFPDRYNTTFIICNGCCKAIENKLVNYKDVKCVDSPDTPDTPEIPEIPEIPDNEPVDISEDY